MPPPKKKKTTTVRKLDVEQLETVFGRRLPDAYRKFISSGAYLKRNGWKVFGLPGFDPAWALPVRFDAPTPAWELEASELGREHKNDPLITVRFRDPAFYPPTRSKKPRPVPIATFQSRDFDGQEFLAMDLSDPKGPVSLWQHGDGSFTRIAPTFDAFLQGLIAPDAKSPTENLLADKERALKLVDGNPKKAEELLTRAVAPFEGLKPSQVEEVTRARVADLYNDLGCSRTRQDRFPQAIAALERGMHFGSAYAALNLAETYAEDLGNFKAAHKVADKILSDVILRVSLGEEKASYVYAVQGLSLLGLGKEEKARESYRLAEEFLQDRKVAKGMARDLEVLVVKKGLPLAGVAAELSARFKGIAKGTVVQQQRPKKKENKR